MTVLAWLLTAVIAVDGALIGLSDHSIRDQARRAAVAASVSYAHQGDRQLALRAAKSSAHAANPANRVRAADFVVASHGTVTVHLQRPIRTLVAHLLPLAQLQTAVADGTASP